MNRVASRNIDDALRRAVLRLLMAEMGRGCIRRALGLYGDTKPHETFTEMAKAHLVEMKTVQSHGPYMIGGSSGGGITA